jgi:hypothetical protein
VYLRLNELLQFPGRKPSDCRFDTSLSNHSLRRVVAVPDYTNPLYVLLCLFPSIGNRLRDHQGDGRLIFYRE